MSESRRRREYERLHPKQRLGDAPVQAEYHDKMVAIMETLDHFLNDGTTGSDRKTGIVIMVFPFGEDVTGRCNYMSNGADRRDIMGRLEQ